MAEDAALDRPLCARDFGKLAKIAWRMILSHGVNMLGSKAWEFAIPLLLIRLSGGRLIAPAMLGIVTTSAEFFLGPSVGRWTDTVSSRLSLVSAGAGIQAAATLCMLVLVLIARAVGCGSTAAPVWFGGQRANFGGLLFVGICICGISEVLGRLITSVSVERDWVPTAFEDAGELTLARINARMANVDLLAEILGPLLAGVLCSLASTTIIGFSIVAMLNIVSFAPQLWLLASAQRHCAALKAPRIVSGSFAGQETSESAEQGAWQSFWRHPSGVAMLTVSYALLFFTVLSSHDVVLTAFLAQVGLDPIALSMFRAFGASAGVVGATSFEIIANRSSDAGWTAGVFIGMQTAAVFIAAGSLSLHIGGTEQAPGWLGHAPSYFVPFLISIVVSRIGLYGFDVGFSTLSQGLVDERHRGGVGAVTRGLCAFAQLCMYAATSVAMPGTSSSGFNVLVLMSACSIGGAAGVFAIWRCLYHEHEHFHVEDMQEEALGHGHVHGHEHGHSHSHGAEHLHEHSHTIQQLRALSGSTDGPHKGLRKHKHVHYHGPRISWLP